jgi:hypothetical protein
VSPTSTVHPVAARLEQNLDTQISRLRREVRWISLIGTVLLICLVAYFTYVVGIVQREMRPKDLAQVTGAFASEFLVQTLQEYSGRLIQSAPMQTAALLDHFLLQTLGLVKDGRFFIIGWIEERLGDIESMVTRVTDTAYSEHVPDLQLLVQDIKSTQGQKAFEEYFTTLLTAPLASESVRIDIESLDLTLQAMKEHLDRLVRQEGLPAEEEVERELLLTTREFWERSTARP